MIIKNTAVLVDRLDRHIAEGKLTPGLFGHGEIKPDGSIAFTGGCLVGCLSVPHRVDELSEVAARALWLNRAGVTVGIVNGAGFDGLQRDHGMCNALVHAMEGAFELRRGGDGSVGTARRLVRALPEGVDIKNEDVQRFLVRLSLAEPFSERLIAWLEGQKLPEPESEPQPDPVDTEFAELVAAHRYREVMAKARDRLRDRIRV